MTQCVETQQLISRFKEFVLEHDLTLQQAASRLKMSHSAVADILNRKTEKPHERTLYKIKKLMGENGVSKNPIPTNHIKSIN